MFDFYERGINFYITVNDIHDNKKDEQIKYTSHIYKKNDKFIIAGYDRCDVKEYEKIKRVVVNVYEKRNGSLILNLKRKLSYCDIAETIPSLLTLPSENNRVEITPVMLLNILAYLSTGKDYLFNGQEINITIDTYSMIIKFKKHHVIIGANPMYMYIDNDGDYTFIESNSAKVEIYDDMREISYTEDILNKVFKDYDYISDYRKNEGYLSTKELIKVLIHLNYMNGYVVEAGE